MFVLFVAGLRVFWEPWIPDYYIGNDDEAAKDIKKRQPRIFGTAFVRQNIRDYLQSVAAADPPDTSIEPCESDSVVVGVQV
jgi:hypothetical protein